MNTDSVPQPVTVNSAAPLAENHRLLAEAQARLLWVIEEGAIDTTSVRNLLHIIKTLGQLHLKETDLADRLAIRHAREKARTEEKQRKEAAKLAEKRAKSNAAAKQAPVDPQEPFRVPPVEGNRLPNHPDASPRNHGALQL